jgi:hypothetical protein
MATRYPLTLLVCLVFASPAFAQSSSNPPLSQLLPDLLTTRVILAPPAVGIDHSAHFIAGIQQEVAPFFFNQALVSQLSRIPLGSSSGGFTFQFDPAAGTFTRTTPTFGPSFAERAVTVGKGKVTFGFNFQRATYDGFEGKDLDGEIQFYLRHIPFATPPVFFEGDLVEETLRLDLKTSTSTLFGSYGVTDRFEVAVAVPIVNVSLDASVDARILRLATQSSTDIHRFPNGTDNATFSDSGSASGIGDILLRGKYVVAQFEEGGLAAGLDLRVPTGDEDDLLGIGTAQATAMFIGSRRYGRFSPHFNVGYTFSGEADTTLGFLAPLGNDEFAYTFGTEIEASPRVTFNADVLGRVLIDVGRLEERDRQFSFMSAEGIPGSATFREFAAVPDSNLNTLTGTIGAKFNLYGNLLLSGNVLFPLKKSGIYDTLTPVIGIDYVF